MKYISLGSGSRGNSTLICGAKGALLVDCGFSKKILLSRFEQADFDAGQLLAVFVTHEHTDHAKGVQAICESLDIPFYSSFGTAQKMGWLNHALWRCIVSDEKVEIEDLVVEAVVVPHDALEPLQYIVESHQGLRFGILSDLGCLTTYLVAKYQGCHALQVEANHDLEMLRKGPYPPKLIRRVAGDYGHLNNGQCADLIRRVQWSGLTHIVASHISEKNNHPSLVQQELANAIGCPPDQVRMLDQDVVSDWYQLSDY